MFVSIIVTYNPDAAHVKNMIAVLVESSLKVLVFDNSVGDKRFVLDENYDGVFLLSENDNLGLAKAFNRSIAFANETFSDVEGFVFFDQDATISLQNMEQFIQEYYRLECLKLNVGVLGASAIDSQGQPYWVKRESGGHNLADTNLVNAWFVMSSFSLVPSKVLDKVGGFDEDLFIDLVDSEFSFRCSKNGFQNIVTKRVEFLHVVGENNFEIFGKRLFAISSPIRNYYQTRNVILVGKKYSWYFYIVKVLSRRIIQIVLSGIKTKTLGRRIVYFSKGFRDGLAARGGRIDGKV